MSKRIVLTMLWMMVAVSLYAQRTEDYRKVSSWLRERMETHRSTLRRADEAEKLTVVFVQFKGEVTDELLATYQCRRYAQLDDIAIVMLPLSQVDNLSHLSTVLRIEANEQAHATSDTIPKIVNTLPMYEATVQHPSFTGEGVVIGVMDVGFDLTHPNFYTDNQYRISAYWDQLATSVDDTRLPVGREFVTPSDILAQGCSTDGRKQNHGTHTLGIAAGGGYDTKYRGVAFESDLCLVSNAVTNDTIFIEKDDYDKYTTATDALGFKYLFDYAEQQNKPCVVSFSEGYTPYVDREDSLYAAFLGKLIGPGRILVSSAGNERVNYTYVEKPRDMEMAGAFVQCYDKDASYRIKADGIIIICLYIYDKVTHELLEVKELTMTGEEQNGVLEEVITVNAEECKVRLSCHASSAQSDKRIYVLELTAGTELNKFADIAIVPKGEGQYAELFGSSSNALYNSDIDNRWNAARDGHNILAPGCFATPICVGATVHRLGFTNAEGEYKKSDDDDAKGLLTYYSSIGPAINGLDKPDITAPGTNIMSSYSSYYYEENPTVTTNYVAYSEVNGRQYPWGSNSGTSMSTPVVAGVIALWLQANPHLTREDIIGVFSRTCRHPEESLSYPNNLYGYGEIDGYRGLLDILGLTGIDTISQYQPQKVLLSVKEDHLYLQFTEIPHRPVHVSIYSVSGALLWQQQFQPVLLETTIPLTMLTSGIYVVQLTSVEQGVTGSQLVRK